MELLFKNSEKNRYCGWYFELNNQRASTRTENNRQELENVLCTEEIDLVRPLDKFFIVYLKDYETAEKTIHYHLIEKLKIKNAEPEENLKKAKKELQSWFGNFVS